MNTQVRLTSEQAPTTAAKFTIMCEVPYEAMSALNRAALATRPNIALAVTTVAVFASKSRQAH
jgi:hypothetical protein